MSEYNAVIPTSQGLMMLTEAVARKLPLIFTKIALGDGVLTVQDVPTMTGLIQQKQEAPVQSVTDKGTGLADVSAVVTNKGLLAGYYARELGVFAKVGDEGEEKLFAYTNAGANASYSPADGSLDEKMITVTFAVGTDVDLHVNLDSQVYVTKKLVSDLIQAHNTSMDAHSELLSQYIRKDGDTATGKIYVPTPETSDNSRVIANTAFVNNIVDELLKRIIGDAPSNMRTMEALATALANDPTFADTMRNELNKRAPLNSPTFSGSVRVPTAGGGENSTIAASTQWVNSKINNSGFIPRGSTRSSYNETGYRVFSDGFTIQWGKIGATRNQWISFPVSFNVKNVTVAMIGMGTGTQSLPYVNGVGNTGFYAGSYDFKNGMKGIYWCAVGKI